VLWYGPKSKAYNYKVVHKRKNLNLNLRRKKLAWDLPRRRTLAWAQTAFNVPSNWCAAVLTSSSNSLAEKRLLYLYNDLYYFKVTLPGPAIWWYFDGPAGVLSQKIFLQRDFFSFYRGWLRSVCQSFDAPFFQKLKIRGKGYYVYRNFRNTITHQLGHSHRTYIYSYFIKFKRNSKTIFTLFGLSKKDVFSVGLRIKSSKKMNIFTGRGIRFSRQIVYKKTGKVSAYR
jgi:hypothetical protein